jgi:hypothetical protein
VEQLKRPKKKRKPDLRKRSKRRRRCLAAVVVLTGISAAVLACTIPSRALSSTISNIPTDTRIQSYVEELARRGMLRGFFFSDLPYSREKVCTAIDSLDRVVSAGRRDLSPYEAWLLERLKQEFQVFRQSASAPGTVETGAELETIGSAKDNELTGTIEVGGEDVEAKASDTEEFVRGIGSGWVVASVLGGVTIAHRFRVDSRIEDDASFLGRVWRGDVGGYVANGYIQISRGPLEALLGRDKLQWGAGRSGSLILSGAAPPLDMVNVTLDFGRVRATGFFTSLDEMRLEKAVPFEHDSLQAGDVVKRHVSGHRIDIRVLPSLEIGLSETIVYGGPDRGLEPGYLNPLNFFYAQQWNLSKNDNPIWSLDACWWPKDRLQVYGQMVVDDYQFEHKGERDKEPAEVGFLVGFHSGDPFGLAGVSLTGEYVRVNPWTYNQPLPWNRYKYGDAVLGHPIGPDADALFMKVGKWFNRILSLELDYSFVRHGETSIDSDWPVPIAGSWGGASFPQGFPLGVASKSHRLGLTARYHPALHFDVDGFASVEKTTDYDNFEGLKSLDLAFGLSVSFRPEWAFVMRP